MLQTLGQAPWFWVPSEGPEPAKEGREEVPGR